MDRKLSPLKIVIYYVAIGSLWIISSDVLLSKITKDPEIYTKLSIVKGWLYVILTAALLHWLISLYSKQRTQTEITLRENEQALRESKDQFRKVVENSPLSMALVNSSGVIEYINLKAVQTFGYPLQDIPNMDRWWVQAYPDKTYRDEVIAQWMGLVNEALTHNHEIEQREYRVTCKNGSVKVTTICGVWIADKVLVVFDDITERKKMEEGLQTLSLTDELTGLHNRRGFFFLADRMMTLAKRQKRKLAMLYADLDGLKEINDTWGHQAGDLMLVETANILKSTYRESDIIARIGGDEFVILQVETANDGSETAVGRLQKEIDARNARRKKGEELSISLGISYFDPENPYTIDAMLSNADNSMYEKKKLKRKL
jgi:diguanylate cyclase (GGDEF)-like protein/PAS domain S-box-containing protein